MTQSIFSIRFTSHYLKNIAFWKEAYHHKIPAEECIATLNGTGLFHKPTFSSKDSTKILSSAIYRADFHHVDSTPKCNSQGPRALAVDGLRDQGER